MQVEVTYRHVVRRAPLGSSESVADLLSSLGALFNTRFSLATARLQYSDDEGASVTLEMC